MTPFPLANLVLHNHDSRAPAGAIDAPRRTAVVPIPPQRRPKAMALSRPRMPRASRITAIWRDAGSSCNLRAQVQRLKI